jgi:hypothetical protein
MNMGESRQLSGTWSVIGRSSFAKPQPAQPLPSGPDHSVKNDSHDENQLYSSTKKLRLLAGAVQLFLMAAAYG